MLGPINSSFSRRRRIVSIRPTLEALEERVILSVSGALSSVAMTPSPAKASSSFSVPAAVTSALLPLGGDLNQQTDRIQDHPFVNLVKVTRGFFNLAGRIDPTTGVAAKATTEAIGWPTEDFSFSAADQSEYGVQITPGTYHLSFTGPAGVVVATTPNAPGRVHRTPQARWPRPWRRGPCFRAHYCPQRRRFMPP